ncbi:hypothetical protein [Sphingomonas endolithica]|uniref:hypothetical protein n=1 Tax=Sphingomonas endolithica TaxID=2972485 RepID=UPI0021AF0CDF|nr:hypothetical protein [Sphingomonas sp. ZFBP2030]
MVALAIMVPAPARARPTFEAASRTCRVLEAAYTAATNSKAHVHPVDVRPSWRSLEPSKFVPDYAARRALTDLELADLASREDRYRSDAFKPLCDWLGEPHPHVDDEGHRMAVSYTSPIFSSDGGLALVEVSFREEGHFGYGSVCIVRAAGKTWSARCWPSWIT